jgi:hypothetical protein
VLSFISSQKIEKGKKRATSKSNKEASTITEKPVQQKQ